MDRQNIYEFPDAFLGTWAEADTFTATFDDTVSLKGPSASSNWSGLYKTSGKEEDSFHLVIEKKYVLLIFYSKQRVVKGAWPKPNKQGILTYPGEYHSKDELEKQIKYDSLLHPVDTTVNYLLFENRIYESVENGYLGKGYALYDDHDTMVLRKKDTLCIDLGQNAFLRQLDEKRYVFNFKNNLFGDASYRFSEWWNIRVLEKNGPDTFLMWECNSKTADLPSMFHAANSRSDIFYFNAQWTTEELSALIKQGYLETGGVYYQRK